MEGFGGVRTACHAAAHDALPGTDCGVERPGTGCEADGTHCIEEVGREKNGNSKMGNENCAPATGLPRQVARVRWDCLRGRGSERSGRWGTFPGRASLR